MGNALEKQPTLHELASEFRETAVKLADMEIDEQTLADTLESMAFPVESKALNVVKFTQNLQAIVDAAREAEKRIAERRRAYEGRIERLKRYVEACMRISGIKKIESPEIVLMLKGRKPRVVIDSAAMVPDIFWRFPDPPAPEIDKNAVYAALKEWNGQGESPVPGAHLEEFDSLEIR